MSEIINEEGNEHSLDIFTVINRNYKTEDREEISGQWTYKLCSVSPPTDIQTLLQILLTWEEGVPPYSYGSDNYAEAAFIKKGTYFCGNSHPSYSHSA